MRRSQARWETKQLRWRILLVGSRIDNDSLALMRIRSVTLDFELRVSTRQPIGGRVNAWKFGTPRNEQ